MDVKEDTRQQHQSPHYVNQQVANRRAERVGRFANQEEKGGANREQLPENKESYQVSRQDDTQGAARIKKARKMLHPSPHVAVVDDPDKGDDDKDIEENQTEFIYAAEDEFEPEDLGGPVGSLLQQQVVVESENGQRQHVGRPYPALEKRDEETSEEKNQGWRKGVTHSSPRLA